MNNKIPIGLIQHVRQEESGLLKTHLNQEIPMLNLLEITDLQSNYSRLPPGVASEKKIK